MSLRVCILACKLISRSLKGNTKIIEYLRSNKPPVLPSQIIIPPPVEGNTLFVRERSSPPEAPLSTPSVCGDFNAPDDSESLAPAGVALIYPNVPPSSSVPPSSDVLPSLDVPPLSNAPPSLGVPPSSNVVPTASKRKSKTKKTVDTAQRPVTRTQSRLQSNHPDVSDSRPVARDSPLTDVPEGSDEGSDIIDHHLYDVDEILAFKYDEQVFILTFCRSAILRLCN
jgi:hypothetical protein